jgi:hypothetical protein
MGAGRWTLPSCGFEARGSQEPPTMGLLGMSPFLHCIFVVVSRQGVLCSPGASLDLLLLPQLHSTGITYQALRPSFGPSFFPSFGASPALQRLS